MLNPLIRKKELVSKLIVGIVGLAVVVISFSICVPVWAQKETVVLAIHASPWLPAYKKLMKMYEEETGNKIEVREYPHRTLYEKEIIAAVEGSDAYDIMHFDPAWTPFFMGMGYATPVKEIDPTFELPAEILDYGYAGRWSFEENYCTPDGILFGVPVNANIQLYFYRGDKFKNAGLGTPPQTWEEVITAAEKLHNPPSFYGYSIITVARVQATYFWLPVLWSFGGGIFADPPGDWTITMDSKEAREALEFDLMMKKYCPPGIGNTSQSDVLSYLATGKLLQAINVSATYPYMDNPEFATEPGKVEFAVPPMKKDIGKHVMVGGGWHAIIPKHAKHKKTALNFLKWTLTKKAQLAYAEAGGVCVRKDVFMQLAATGERKWRFCKAYYDAIPYIKMRPITMKWPKIVDAVAINFQNALTEKITVDEAIGNMARKIREIMEK